LEPSRGECDRPMADLTPVLIIAYFFPPLGGAGTQRFAKFVKWLPKLGYRPIVVACDPAGGASMPEDPTLMADVAQEAVVARVPEPRGRSGVPWLTQLGMAAGFWMDHEPWVHAALPVAEKLGRTHGVKAIITTVSPYASAAMGRELRRRLGAPWLLDLRDPWALDGWRLWPTPLHAWGDGVVMKRALRDADIVIANCPEAGAAYSRFASLDSGRLRVISNGFDPDDFDAASAPAPADEFRLVHVGTLHNPVGPDGRSRKRLRDVQELGRTGRYLYEAVAQIRERERELYDLLRVELIGNVHAGHRKLAEQLGITDRIRERGYVDHHAAVTAMKSADVLFVPLHGLPEGEKSLVVPGKLYEVLASGRPVLACVPPGDAARLVELTGAGAVCRPDDVGAIASALAGMIRRWRDGRPTAGAPARLMTPLTRESLSKRLVEAIGAARGGPVASGTPDPWCDVEALAREAPGVADHGPAVAPAGGAR
jgi:glycosyltransferase involved in cell wall biosynthesis